MNTMYVKSSTGGRGFVFDKTKKFENYENYEKKSQVKDDTSI